jgi:L-ascorbate metabolism protein UlaG (beta-lactamase superfamily)
MTRDGVSELRWLGTAGIELRDNGHVLVVDPYLTRTPLWNTWVGRVQSNREFVADKIQDCDHILITHPHWDHMLDVPEIVRNTGATAYGSSNSCRLLSACGVSPDKIQEIVAGDELELDGFGVEVFSSEHMKVPGFGPGKLAANLSPPLKARDYCMDEQFCFRITAGGCRLLTSPGVRSTDAVPADVLFVIPKHDKAFYEKLLRRVQPKVVIPYHWDNFFRSLEKPLRPLWQPPKWAWPPLERMDPAGFRRLVEQIALGTSVFVPQVFRSQDLGEFT